jgi:predicted F0F1-ATPase subunit
MMKTKRVLKLDSSGYKIIEREDASRPVKSKTNGVYILAQASEIGFSIAIPITLGVLGGVWLDSKWGSHPKATLSLLFVGILFAFLSLFYTVRTFSKRK